MISPLSTPWTKFQSTLSSRRATQGVAEGITSQSDFNPRSPHGERLDVRIVSFTASANISIHALLTESDEFRGEPLNLRSISIHALLTESDLSASRFNFGVNISIHALLTESDGSCLAYLALSSSFQSTLSSRRATYLWNVSPNVNQFQSTLSSRRATANTTKLALSFLSKVPILGWEKSKKAKGSANARGSFPVYGKNKVRIPWGDFECFRFAPIK